MRRANFLLYIALIIILPISIVLLSGNIVLRVSETYVYHFNDSQVVEEVGSYVSGNEFAKSITGYFNKPGKDEFQVYEENGEFRDPIFEEKEISVMSRAKTIMTLTLFTGIILFGAGIAIYIYLAGTEDKGTLRFMGIATMIVSLVEIIASGVLLGRQSVRTMLYNRFIGIELGKDSALHILLSSPFEKSFIIFSSVLAVAITAVFLYIHISVTKEKRLFS